MSVTASDQVPIRTEQDIVRARQLVRQLSLDSGFSLVDQTKIVTAASEIARNTLTYGGGGTLVWEKITAGMKKGVRLTFVDEGPGIADVSLAMTEGWTSGSGLGMGLAGAKRLVNEFDLQTAPGKGTRVTLARWK